MVAVSIDLSDFSAALKASLEKLTDPEYLLRPICLEEIDLMTKRIHVDGVNSAGDQIGSYNKNYLKYVREKKYHRSSDPKIISSLTRQQENDWSVIPTEDGYGIGFKNSFNYQKARWVEEQKEQEIFSLSTTEFEYAQKRLAELVEQAFTK